MKFPRIFRRERKVYGRVTVEGYIPNGYLIASTEKQADSDIRESLVRAHLIHESTLNLETAAKTPAYKISGVTYPEDSNDFRDYLDAYYYVPFVARPFMAS